MFRSPDNRVVVRSEKDFMGRIEVEPLLMKEPCRDGVAAGHLLDQALGQPIFGIGLAGDNEPRTLKARYVVRYGAASLDQERFSRRRHGIVAENGADGLEKRGLAVGPGAVEDEEALLGGFASQCVSNGPLKE